MHSEIFRLEGKELIFFESVSHIISTVSYVKNESTFYNELLCPFGAAEGKRSAVSVKLNSEGSWSLVPPALWPLNDVIFLLKE